MFITRVDQCAKFKEVKYLVLTNQNLGRSLLHVKLSRYRIFVQRLGMYQIISSSRIVSEKSY